ncbi:MAG: pyridoxamine 5'-phosphate oxidase family protein [archaeon]|nr:pyridoxamine 5'-phosphate oxidase family protein [archaeon]MCP8317198.1 pyridoxamine 5'-phosphate oxidase family protein [archaeon]MCP8320707.1 pyridoxamine 5'-phosphate oxidase family protein [archaeon]
MGNIMVKLPEEVKKVAVEAVSKRTCVVGTTNKKCIPNAVPMSTRGYPKVLDDDKFVMVDNYLNKTRKNLEENPFATITFWNPETFEGYQVKGPVEIKSSGDLYEQIKSEIHAKRPDLPVKAIVILKVEEIYNIRPGSEAGKRIA